MPMIDEFHPNYQEELKAHEEAWGELYMEIYDHILRTLIKNDNSPTLIKETFDPEDIPSPPDLRLACVLDDMKRLGLLYEDAGRYTLTDLGLRISAMKRRRADERRADERRAARQRAAEPPRESWLQRFLKG